MTTDLFSNETLRLEFEQFQRWRADQQQQVPQPKRHKSYADDHVTNILGHAPTKANAKKLALEYGRSQPAIEMIWRRWQSPNPKHQDAFTDQIDRCGKRAGLIRFKMAPA